MHKYIYLTFPVLLFIAACSKKSDVQMPGNINPKTATLADLSGKWLVRNDTTFSIVNGQAKIDSILTPPFKKNAIATYLQFNADGTCFSDVEPTSHHFTLNAGNITIYSPYNGGSDPPEIYTILVLSQHSLLLQTNTTAKGYIHVTLAK